MVKYRVMGQLSALLPYFLLGSPGGLLGEARDAGCHQWMRVQWNKQRLGVYGNQVRQ
jgi:hypothetical protein